MQHITGRMFKTSNDSPSNKYTKQMENINKIERPGTLQALAYDKIKGLMIAGELDFDSIFSTNQFAEILGVSRTPVREALLQLSAEGLLTSMQGRGFKIKKFSENRIKEFFETRQMIESYIIERLAGSNVELDLSELDKIIIQMKNYADKSDIYGFLETDKAFHMNLIRRHGNRYLTSIMENIRDLIAIFGRKALASPGRIHEVITEHQVIIQTLKQKNKQKAVESIKYHLTATEKSLVENQ
jgi:DNA-binding GntR family transcriptional regulator